MRNKSLIFVCSHAGCSAKYYRKDRLDIHMRRHTGERPFICTYDNCDKSYIRFEHLKRHELIHEEGSISCPYEDCDVILKTPATLKKHIDIYHLKTKIKLYKCSLCNKTFHKHSLLKVHENQHKNLKPHKCPEEGCQKTFLTPSKLARHSKIHKGYKCTYATCDKISKTWSLHLKHLKIDHSTVSKCPHCSRAFNYHRNLKKHLLTHEDPENRQCILCPEPNCSRFYFEMKNLRFHIKKNHGGALKCREESCSLSFQNEESRTKHCEQVHKKDTSSSSNEKKTKKKKQTKLSFASKLAGLSKQANVISNSSSTANKSKHEEKPKRSGLPTESIKCFPKKDLMLIEIFLDDNAAKSFGVNNEEIIESKTTKT